MPDYAAAKTVAAMHGAAFCCDQQCSAVILVQHAVALVVLVVAIGVSRGGPHGTGNPPSSSASGKHMRRMGSPGSFFYL